jgi:hypothetical protein
MSSRRKRRRMDHGKGKIEKSARERGARGSLTTGQRTYYDPGNHPRPRRLMDDEAAAAKTVIVAVETRQLRRARARGMS